MKFNKLIARGLSIGLLINSVSTLSYANTEIPNRYQTLESDYITINNSIEGNLEEIEIFGNTVQDSGSKNLFSSKLEKGHIDKDGNLINNNNSVRSVDFIEVKPSTYYSFGIVGYNGYLYIHEYDENYSVLGEKSLGSSVRSFQTNHNTKYIKINTYSSPDYKLDIDAKVQLNEGKILLDYEPYRIPNLSDIQSIGDLYVDENGNPILDSQGREQYKIDIVSVGKNLLNENRLMSGWGGKKPWFIELGMSDNIITDYILVKKNTDYIINKCFSYLWLYDETKNLIKEKNNLKPGEFFNTENATYLILGRSIASVNINQSIYKGTQLEEGNIRTEFQNYEEKRESILLPTQLQKVGNVKDKLYWDNNKHKYIIEKNIDKIVINNNSPINKYDSSTVNTSGFWVGEVPVKNIGINNTFLNSASDIAPHAIFSYEDEAISYNWGVVKFSLFKNKLKEDSVNGVKEYLKLKPIIVYSFDNSSQLIETSITSKLKIPTYDEKTHIYVDSENGINPTLKATIDRLPQIAKEAIAQAESDNSNQNIALARMYINMLPESSYKDQLQNQLSDIFSSDMVLDMKIATSNIDVYIKSENILQMSIDTNSISFDDFSGIDDVVKENAVNITINSSLPYQLNAYLPNEIQNNDKTKTLDKSILNIKENSESEYKEFANINEKVILKDNCSSGNYLTHGVDLKLARGIAHEKDVYKATIKLEAEQK